VEKINLFLRKLETYNLADKIAKNVLLGNTEYISNLNILNPKLNYNKSVESNPFAKSIIDSFTKRFDITLTGSLAIAGQGENIYRPESEPIHDIDFIVDDKSKMEDIAKFLEESNAIPLHYGIKGDDYVTMSYSVPKKGYTVEPAKVTSFGYVDTISLKNEKGEYVQPNAENVMSVDFFVYNVKSNKTVAESKFTSWQDIYKGKLFLSRLKSGERMFARPKDQLDYVLANPVNRDIELAQFTYLQTEDMTASKASKETLELIKNAAKQMGVSIQDLADYAKSVGLDTKSINGVSDLTRGVF